MIGVVKAVLSSVLVRSGLSRSNIALDARAEQAMVTNSTELPIASLISEPGRFEAAEIKEVKIQIENRTLYRQVRTKRVLPVLVKVVAINELEAGNLLSGVISNLPFVWEYQGIEGELEPTREKYSDYDSRMNGRYEAAVLVEFSVDVGPSGTSAAPINAVAQGGGEYEEG